MTLVIKRTPDTVEIDEATIREMVGSAVADRTGRAVSKLTLLNTRTDITATAELHDAESAQPPAMSARPRSELAERLSHFQMASKAMEEVFERALALNVAVGASAIPRDPTIMSAAHALRSAAKYVAIDNHASIEFDGEPNIRLEEKCTGGTCPEQPRPEGVLPTTSILEAAHVPSPHGYALFKDAVQTVCGVYGWNTGEPATSEERLTVPVSMLWQMFAVGRLYGQNSIDPTQRPAQIPSAEMERVFDLAKELNETAMNGSLLDVKRGANSLIRAVRAVIDEFNEA